MGRGPVVRLVRLDDDVAVQAHLLGVVLAHVRVVPVHAGVGEAQPVGEVPTRPHRVLHAAVAPAAGHAVVEVVVPQAVPVHGGVEVKPVHEPADDLRALPHPDRRTRDRAVVGEQADVGLADALAHGRGLQLERTAGRDRQGLRRVRLLEPADALREVSVVSWEYPPGAHGGSLPGRRPPLTRRPSASGGPQPGFSPPPAPPPGRAPCGGSARSGPRRRARRPAARSPRRGSPAPGR